MPRYKVRGEGDEVKTGDQILLVSIKAPGHYLTQSQTRFSKTDGLDGLLNDGDFEVNPEPRPNLAFFSLLLESTLRLKPLPIYFCYFGLR